VKKPASVSSSPLAHNLGPKPIKIEPSEECIPPEIPSQLKSDASYNSLPVKLTTTPTPSGVLRNLPPTPTSQTSPPKPVHLADSLHESKFGPRGSKRTASPTSSEKSKQRMLTWPTMDRLNSARLAGEGELGIREIAFNSDGSQFVLCCEWPRGL
jgi:hypothetical protein